MLELNASYIADAIIETKEKRFNEDSTTVDEVNIIKQIIQKRIEQKNLKVKITDGFFKKYFSIINGIITKIDKETESLKQYISSIEIREAIYDEDFVYLCLCEILINNVDKKSPFDCNIDKENIRKKLEMFNESLKRGEEKWNI